MTEVYARDYVIRIQFKRFLELLNSLIIVVRKVELPA
jgi:hypothetical protein